MPAPKPTGPMQLGGNTIGGMRPAPTRSRLIAKFGKAKAVNPFAEEEKRAIQNMAEGTQAILNMHNSAELSSLCGCLHLSMEGTNKEKKNRIQQYVAEETMRTHNPEKAYTGLLTFMWEGILYEYLRSQGCTVRNKEHDPRSFTLLFWRKRALEQHGGTYRPHYMPRLVRPRFVNDKLDDDLRALCNGVSAKEVYVKESEKRIRANNDYRNMVMYLASVTDLHDLELDARQYLLTEVMALRGRVDHQAESVELLNAQASELEGKHGRMAAQWCSTLAASEASVDAYAGMLNDGLCEANAMAGRIEKCLERHGGRAANGLHPTHRAGIGALVPRLLARFNHDLANAAAQSADAAGALARCRRALDKQARVLRAETARADHAEERCRRWAARHGALQRAAAARIAQLETEAQWLGAEAGSGLVERRVQAQRFALVRPHLLAQLGSGKAAEEATAASTLEVLGMMDRAGIATHLEQRAMQREDLKGRADRALAAAVHAPGGGGKKKDEREEAKEDVGKGKGKGGAKKGGAKKRK